MHPSHSAGCFYFVPADQSKPEYHRSPFVQQHSKWYQLPLIECRAKTSIQSIASRTHLTQSFMNIGHADIKACTYTFPLYDGVSVVDFTCRIGDRLLQGVVKERYEAKAEYDVAVAKGEKVGLLEQNLRAWDVFKTSLGNVPKDETVHVEIVYVSELKHDLETDSLRFEMPTGIAPRYRGAQDSHLDIYECEVSQLPVEKNFSWTVDIEMPHPILQIQSPTHPVSVLLGQLSDSQTAFDPNHCSANMTLQNESGLSKELVMTIKSQGSNEPIALLEAHPKIKNQRALLVTLVPNFKLPTVKPEIVFVCDRSSSMGGTPIETLKQAMKIMVHSLLPGVKFNICSFGTHHSFLWEKSQTYDRETLKHAVAHLDTFDANLGGTETGAAIRGTIESRSGDVALEIILLTDGGIWNHSALFNYLIDRVAESKGQIRVFPLGIGSGVSTAFVEGVARAGNGFASTVMEGERMDQRCVRMLRAAHSPHVTNYTLEVKYEEEPNDDFEIIDKFDESDDTLQFPVRSKQQTPTEEVSISLFDPSIDAEQDMKMRDNQSHLPEVTVPKVLQTPSKVPTLYAFSRTTVYLLLSAETVQRKPKSVILRGTCDPVELKLEIPVHDSGVGTTIHQLAARKACQELEDGRGWIYDIKKNGKSLKELHQSFFDDLVKREAVRLGTQFQVMNKWCSFIARQEIKDSKEIERAPPADGSPGTKSYIDLVDQIDQACEPGSEDDDDAMGFGYFLDEEPSPPMMPQMMMASGIERGSGRGGGDQVVEACCEPAENIVSSSLPSPAPISSRSRGLNTKASHAQSDLGGTEKEEKKSHEYDARHVHAIIGLQEFDGSWEVSKVKELAEILGFQAGTFTRPAARKSIQETAWVTAKVVEILESKMQAEMEVWEMAVEKAKAWLEEQLGEGWMKVVADWRTES